MSNKFGIRDVLNYFKTADLDAADLALELGADAVKSRRAAKEAIGKRLSKARAAKGKGKAATPSAEQAAPAVQRGPGRPRHVGEPAAHQPDDAVATA